MYRQTKANGEFQKSSTTTPKLRVAKSAVAIFKQLHLGVPDAEAKRELKGRWLATFNSACAWIDHEAKVFSGVTGHDADKRALRAGLRAMNYTSTRRRLMRVAW